MREVRLHLISIRRTIFLCVLTTAVCLSACGSPEDDEQRVGPEVGLPGVSAAGVLPAVDRRVDIVLDKDGGLFVNAKATTLETLGDAVVAATGGPRRRVARTALTATLEETQDLEEALEEELEEEVEEAVPEEGDAPEDTEVVVEPPVIHDERDTELPFAGPPEAGGIGTAKQTPAEDDAANLADASAGPFESDGTRTANALLWVASDVPAEAVMRVLMALADPRVKLYRVFFAVHSRASGQTRSLAVFLPRDRGRSRNPFPSPVERLEVSFVEDGRASSGSMIARVIRAAGPVVVSVVTEPRVPIQRILDVVDGALQAKAFGLTFEGLPARETSLPELVRAARGAATFGVRVGKTIVSDPATAKPRSDAATYAGFANTHDAISAIEREEAELPAPGK